MAGPARPRGPRRPRRGPRVAALEDLRSARPRQRGSPARRAPRLRPLLPLARALTRPARPHPHPRPPRPRPARVPARARPPPRAAQRQPRCAPPSHAALRVEVSGAKGWIELPLAGARLATGRPGDDYWSLLAEPRALAEDRPGLRLQLVVGPELGPLAPIPGSADRWPTLRLTLRPRWDASAREWTTNLSPFEPLVLAAVHLRVEVEGLVDLRLQHEDRPLDPRAGPRR
jgi:hypothetical protein